MLLSNLSCRLAILLASVLSALSCDEQSHIEEYGHTVSPDGEVSAHVYQTESPYGKLTQVTLDYTGLGCGSGAASWYEKDIGVELHWVDSETLEVLYPEGLAYQHNPSGDWLICYDRGVRVVMVPRGSKPSTGASYTSPRETDSTLSPNGRVRAYAFRYHSPHGGISQVVIEFVDVRGCESSAVTFYDSDVPLKLTWQSDNQLDVSYPAGTRLELPPWNTTSRCSEQSVELSLSES